MTSDIMIIPADPRYTLNKQPLITNEMKAECIGEFSWQEEADYYDEDGNYIEHVETHTVPWNLCKEIYKRMAMVAAQHKPTEPDDDYLDIPSFLRRQAD